LRCRDRLSILGDSWCYSDLSCLWRRDRILTGFGVMRRGVLFGSLASKRVRRRTLSCERAAALVASFGRKSADISEKQRFSMKMGDFKRDHAANRCDGSGALTGFMHAVGDASSSSKKISIGSRTPQARRKCLHPSRFAKCLVFVPNLSFLGTERSSSSCSTSAATF
jgi:hypothetical protein